MVQVKGSTSERIPQTNWKVRGFSSAKGKTSKFKVNPPRMTKYAGVGFNVPTMWLSRSLMAAPGPKRCKVTVATKTRRVRVRRRSKVKLGKIGVSHTFIIKAGIGTVGRRNRITKLPMSGIDAIIYFGNNPGFRKSLDVKVTWDARKQKIRVNGRLLTSTKMVGTGLQRRLQYDQKKLAELLRPQMDVIYNDKLYSGNSRVFKAYNKASTAVATLLQKFYQAYRKRFSAFKKDSSVKKLYKLLFKRYKEVREYLSHLRKDGQRITSWKRQKGRFTSTFLAKLRKHEIAFKAHKKLAELAKKKLGQLLYKFWWRHYKRRTRKPCP